MSRAKDGDRVKIHYIKRLESGRILDSSKEGNPLEITIGRNIVPLFEQAVKGMEIGQVKTVHVPSENAHGPRRNELKVNVNRSQLPKDVNPRIGTNLSVRKPDGSIANAVILEIKKNTVLLDLNHPLAGESINFDIELVEIK